MSAAGNGTAPSDPASALELPDDVDFQLGQYKHLLGELQKALQAATAVVPGPADLAAVPEPLERARLCLCIAKAVNALHHVYIRSHGRDPFAPSTAGGVSVGRQELDRIRQYDKKVARAVQDASRPVISLDVAAASRFIDAAIPDLMEKQRRDLKRAAQAAEAKRGGPDRRKGKKPRQQSQQQQKQSQQQRSEEKRKAAAQEAEEVTDEDEEEEEENDGKEAEEEEEAGAVGEGQGEREGAGTEASEGGRKKAKGGGAAAAAAASPSGAQAAAEQFLAALASAGGPWGPQE
ncbi:hypothetical protein PLESTB_001710000 [Pleodorina starrii]|uniref:Nuclear nucleic acid-binding protein C1D n=1 Tax=Pleodorina starrii TaxID=330485 RepID=A0A9W6C0B0_9CHLO|nr:hypothetical protein PLESTB_001710000 [Pleodorina starrii]GLC75844.1 hypothetical protein PLESTF_001695400 [Pleodorina starrii]